MRHSDLNSPDNNLSLYCSHDHRGELYRVNWSHFGRDSHLDCDIDNVEELYKAMRTFDDIMNDPKNHIRLKMEPGKERLVVTCGCVKV